MSMARDMSDLSQNRVWHDVRTEEKRNKTRSTGFEPVRAEPN